MKASELIYQLEDLLDKHGDKEVLINGYGIMLVDYDIVDEYINIEG